MTTFDLNVTPTTIAMQLASNTGLSVSSMISSGQSTDRQGYKWHAQLTFSTLVTDDRADLMGTLAALRGQANRLRVKVKDNPNRGTYGGTPLVDGAAQTGSSLLLKGAGTVTNWIRKGDYFSVIVNGEPELKMATADANSSAGAVTVAFEPRLRAAPADSAVIYVEDGVLTVPSGIFLLKNPINGWASKAFSNGQISSTTLDLIEDVFATQ